MKMDVGGKCVIFRKSCHCAWLLGIAYLSFCNGFKLWSVSAIIFFLVCALGGCSFTVDTQVKTGVDAKGILYTVRCFLNVASIIIPEAA